MPDAPLPPPAQPICDAFGLGSTSGAMTRVRGGMTHGMWRMKTDRGVFAIKQFSFDPANPGHWAPWIERAFTIETAAHDAGVPSPKPIAVGATGRCLAEVPASVDGGAVLVRAHAWADGEPLARTVHGRETSAEVGAILARIHTLGIAASDDARGDVLRTMGEEHWRTLAENMERSNIAWAWEFRAILPAVAELEDYVVASRADAGPLVMSHRDADQKNFMRTPGGELLLVDWDVAGPVHARHEVAKEALNWAGVHLGEPDAKVSRALIDGYRRAGGELDEIRPGDLGEFVAILLGWTEANARRAINAGDDDAERTTRAHIARRTMQALPRFQRSLDRWTKMLDA